MQILIVDDDDAKRLALKAALTPLGFSIVEADSGVAALRCVMAQDFALILLDVFMPIMDGFETAGLIRQRKQSEMTPIIFITASNSDEVTHVDRFAQGAVDFIFAPVNPGELRAKVSVFANLFTNAEQLAIQARDVQGAADHLRLVTDVAPIGIFQTDGQGRYAYTNPRWSEITGIPRDEAVGRGLETVIASEHRFDLAGRLAAPFADHAEFSYRFSIPQPDGPPRVAVMTAVPIPSGDGGNAGMIGTIADVTAETEAEAAMSEARDAANSASQLKSDFLANMSHEIRTPMNGVIGMADLLLETDLDGCQRDYAETVRKSAEALLTIINDILDFSKVEAGMLDIEAEDFQLRTVIDDVVDLLAGTAQAKDIELVVAVDPSVPPEVRGDPGRLRQVLLNLIGNAIKFTEHGDVLVRVSSPRPVASGELTLRFEVRDSGVGIPPDKVGAVFEPFVQADTSTSRKHGGTGLGLAISGQLVTLMGGDYGVTSKPMEGSTFWFTIRVWATCSDVASAAPRPRGDMAGLTALIVDDNSVLREMLVETLTDWGMRVTGVDSAAHGLTALRKSAEDGAPFSIALFDQALPGLTASDLRSGVLGGSATPTPLILMAGVGESDMVGTTGTSEFSALVTKPIHSDALLACLRKAIGLDAVDPPQAVSSDLPDVTGGTGGRGRLLLAEDNLINQKVAVAMLSSAGYSIDTVLDGFAAVEASAVRRYDAILMDCQMPGMNGYEATAAIRAEDGANRHTPIIALTAGARSEDRDRCLANGMDAYLSKPASKDALLEIVATSMRRWPLPPTSTEADPLVDVVDRCESTGTSAGGSGLDVPEDRETLDVTSLRDPARHPDPWTSVLDPTVLGQLERLGEATGEDLVGQLAMQFLADADEHLVSLHHALAASDIDSLSRSAHALTGSSANLGASELSRLCRAIAAEDGPEAVAHAELAVSDVAIELERVRAAFDAWAASR